MSCPCEKPVKFPKEKVCGKNTPPVIQINSRECPILFHTMVISAAEGDVNSIPPTIGAHKNLRVYYEANRTSYLYDSDGVPQVLSGMVTSEVHSVNGRTGEVTLGRRKCTHHQWRRDRSYYRYCWCYRCPLHLCNRRHRPPLYLHWRR